MNKLSALPGWLKAALLLPAGAIAALANAPDPLPGWFLPWLQIGGLALLFYWLLRLPTQRRALQAAFWFGSGYFALGLYWVFISLHRYGGMSAWLAATAVAVLAAGMALYYVLFAALARWLAPYKAESARPFDYFYLGVVWASAWCLGEWLRGTLFTGLPWLNSAYAHVGGFLAGWAPVVGVYGISWVTAFLATGLALVVLARDTVGDRPASLLALCGGILLAGGFGLKQLNWHEPAGQPVLVRLAQGNIPQSEKFDPALVQQGLDTYMQLAALPPKEEGATPDIVVLPETIMVLFQDRYPETVWEHWRTIAQATQSAIIMGAPVRSSQTPSAADTHSTGNALGQTRRHTNSALLLTPNTPINALLSGQASGRYDKHHLVPFGEFIPPGFRWFVDAMEIPLGDFDRGALRQPLFTVNDQVIAPNICYEDVFGEEIIASVRPSQQAGPGATILVNISNLAWFGDSLALGQHLQIARMRAIETARPMLRATNTGMTAAIAPDGQLRAVLPSHITGVLDVEVQGTQGLTPYVEWGNRPVIVWALLFLLAALGRRLQRKT